MVVDARSSLVMMSFCISGDRSGKFKKVPWIRIMYAPLGAYFSGSACTIAGEKIKNIIHQNSERFFRNSELVALAVVSLKSAETKFKALFGVTIHQYILHFKVEQAMATLKTFPEMSLREIAYNLGFYDEYHFSRQFKKATGLSPSTCKRLRG